MKNSILKYSFLTTKFLFIGFMLNGVLSIEASASDFKSPSVAWKLSQGGKIYDNWANVLKSARLVKTHPAYPKTSKKTGSATWRCKECHGWDYNGSKGAYRKGSHYTGIKGIRGMAGKSVNTIKSVIRNNLHGYTESMISDKALDNLALFVSTGQVDMAKYIDYETKKVTGDPEHGVNFFQTICAVCHGLDGKKINFHKGRKIPEYIGTVAQQNPWEILHKVRSGQPGAAMISLRTLDIQTQLDIIAYAQLLPIK